MYQSRRSTIRPRDRVQVTDLDVARRDDGAKAVQRISCLRNGNPGISYLVSDNVMRQLQRPEAVGGATPWRDSSEAAGTDRGGS